jgi:protein required for attachment to host cells
MVEEFIFFQVGVAWPSREATNKRENTMSQYCVVAAEVARARIFTLEPVEVPEFDSGPNLVERKTLTNPQHKARDSEYWTDTRRGAQREHTTSQRAGQVTGIPHHNYDEHREDNERQNNRFFARDIAQELDRMIAKNGFRRVILCAEKQMLGYLRPEINGSITNKVELQEVPKDLTSFSPHALHEKLAGEGFLPRRKGRVPPG